MTRKELSAITEMILTAPVGYTTRRLMAETFAARMAEDNARFDRAAFIKEAAGLRHTKPLTESEIRQFAKSNA